MMQCIRIALLSVAVLLAIGCSGDGASPAKQHGEQLSKPVTPRASPEAADTARKHAEYEAYRGNSTPPPASAGRQLSNRVGICISCK